MESVYSLAVPILNNAWFTLSCSSQNSNLTWCAFIVQVDSVYSSHSHAFGDGVSWFGECPWLFLELRCKAISLSYSQRHMRERWLEAFSKCFLEHKQETQEKETFPSCMPGFLNFSTIDIWGWLILCHEGCPVHYLMFSSNFGLQLWWPRNVSRHCQMSPTWVGRTPSWEQQA